MNARPPVIFVAVLFGAAAGLLARTASAQTDDGIDFFERKIRPVLVEHCFPCHAGPEGKVKGGLRLDSRETLRTGGESGPAVVPGKPNESLLLQALRYESLEMPPRGKLSPETIADFERWISLGAPDPRAGGDPPPVSPEVNWSEARQFWSFQPPRRSPIPAVSRPDWGSRTIDSFVLRGLDVAGLSPNPTADRLTLIRRVTLDLTGLPPSNDEVAAFAEDESPQAYERVVERLLASPQAGERWARLWLDIVRFGEDQAHIVGNDRSLCYPNAYLYRDWVIQAWNGDLPYDQFVRQQLAADLLNPQDAAEHVALGFIGLGPKYYRRNSPEVMADEWEDRVDVVSRGLLGLTVACARCHDHKYDPVPTEDYYALAGVFASTEMFNRPLSEQDEKDASGQAKKPERAIHLIRDKEPRDLHVHRRGDVKQLGPLVQRGYLRVLSTNASPAFSQGSGRVELANAIAHRDNPLTARVIVNRVWGQLFGRPLVGTTSNFGRLGENPSHPELLDDLAVRFMEHGWSLKWLQRELVLSSTYRQSSAMDLSKQSADGENRWLWRMPRRRLSAEAWRDAVLYVSGQLDERIGGPSIQPEKPTERRRTVYSEASRLKVNSLLALFDFPDPNVHSEKRTETTTPLQKLFAMNSPFMLAQAEALAAAIGAAIEAQSQDDGARLEWAYRRVFSRAPTDAERRMSLEFLSHCEDTAPSHRWTQFAQVLLASNELLIVD